MTQALHVDFSKGKEWLKKTISALNPASGTCVFIDLCSSTGIKQKGKQQWILYLGNSFTLMSSDAPILASHMIKVIGDELMAFVPDSDLDASGHEAIFLEVKAVLTKWHNEIDDMTLRSKAAIHHCNDVFNITFHRNVTNDYYGVGIDLTARLMKKAIESRIVISHSFYQKISSTGSVVGIKGRYIENFKGIPGDTEFWIYDV